MLYLFNVVYSLGQYQDFPNFFRFVFHKYFYKGFYSTEEAEIPFAVFREAQALFANWSPFWNWILSLGHQKMAKSNALNSWPTSIITVWKKIPYTIICQCKKILRNILSSTVSLTYQLRAKKLDQSKNFLGIIFNEHFSVIEILFAKCEWNVNAFTMFACRIIVSCEFKMKPKSRPLIITIRKNVHIHEKMLYHDCNQIPMMSFSKVLPIFEKGDSDGEWVFILLLYFSRDVHQIWADAAMVELQKKLVKARGTQMLHLKSFEILKDKVRFIKCNSERRRRNTFF